MRGPCLDPDLVDICDDCCDDTLTGMDPARIEQIKRMALYYLWSATGRRFGLCEVTYRPCRKDCRNLTGDFPWPFPTIPYRQDGSWFNLTCGKCPGTCGCDLVSEVFIQGTDSVVNIREDGVDYDPVGMVAVYDRERIIRIDGAEWPACQNLSDIDGSGTWSITVMQGTPWPDGFGVVAGILACELAKACTGNKSCRLPQRVQTITRQNVTIGFQDKFEGLAQLHTGLWEVDAFIEAARFLGFTGPSITSPDWPEAPELTWPDDPFESPGEEPPSIPNPGFEDGVAPWTTFHATAVQDAAHVHSGLAALKASPAGTFADVGVTVTNAHPSTQYTVSMWLYLEDAPGRALQIYASSIEADGVTRVTVNSASFTPPLDTWSLHSFTFTSTSVMDALRVGLVLSGSSAVVTTVWMDDVTIVKTGGS